MQDSFARFRDANKSFSSAVAKTQEEALTNEYNLAYSVYSELAKQMEQAKIAVNETTPILTIVEPVVVPIERSKPVSYTHLYLLVLMYTPEYTLIYFIIVFSL